MNKLGFSLVLSAAFIVGFALAHSTNQASAATSTQAAPSQGWTLHIDAQKHFGAHPDEIAHHWCKPVDGMIECQIYDSDAPNAHLVAIETIVAPDVYKSFSADERALWHYHKDEIPKVNASLPDLSPADAQKVVAQITDTYGKVWLLYDPMSTNNRPTGAPTITVLK